MAEYGDYDLVDFQTSLGIRVNTTFKEAKRDRQDVERRLLRDLRQYKGQYDPEIAAKMHPKRSKAFMRLTRTKVKTVTARLMDLLFPATGRRTGASARLPSLSLRLKFFMVSPPSWRSRAWKLTRPPLAT